MQFQGDFALVPGTFGAGQGSSVGAAGEGAAGRSIEGGVWAPRWIHTGQGIPTDGAAMEQWALAAGGESGTSVHFLPSLALGRHQHTEAPLVYAQWRANGRISLASLAVLPTKHLPIPVLESVGWKTHLRGRRVLENSLLGESSDVSLDAFCLALARELRDGGSDCIIFSDLDVDSPMRPALKRVARQEHLSVVCPSSPSPYWWIRFPDKAEDYWKQFSKKTRYNFRYRAKHLEHSVRCFRQPGEVAAYMDHVSDLMGRTWQCRRLGMDGDVRRRLELLTAAAKAGAFRSYLLMQNDKPLAFGTGLQWRGRYIYEETGYDPSFAAQSPGQVLLYRILEDLIAADTPRLFDFGFGDSEYKRIFANYQTTSGPVVLIPRRLRPLALMALTQVRHRSGRLARDILDRLRILSAIRHIHRGHSSTK